MKYQSTRNNQININSSEAIVTGLSKEGGLFVPTEMPVFTEKDFENLLSLDYINRAAFILKAYLTDFSESELKDYCTKAYRDKFYGDNVTNISKVNDINILELWHGPTCAFKDFALQLLPHLLTASMKKTGVDKTVCILVATSGDTGKAALDGFADVNGTKIMVFYPSDGVSNIQKLQMLTQKGENVNVCAVKGNFDDTQTGVKEIFTDNAYEKILSDKNYMLSSANSINWGRLVPQIVYYISAYCDLINAREIKYGEKVNICVPTGNFGNILAAYYAMQAGLPVNKFICASNMNNVLTEFINSGIYNKNRSFHTTISPSMDILISSNLERLLYELSGKDYNKIKEWTNALKDNGKYEVDSTTKARLKELFYAGYANDKETKETIAEKFENSNYLCDTHTAVAVKVYEDYKKETADNTPVILASTANPYKFSDSVLDAISKEEFTGTDFELLDKLQNLSNLEIPKALSSLKTAKVLFDKTIDKQDMKQSVSEFLK